MKSKQVFELINNSEIRSSDDNVINIDKEGSKRGTTTFSEKRVISLRLRETKGKKGLRKFCIPLTRGLL